jgi:DNA primase
MLGVKAESLNDIFQKLKQNVNKSPRAKQYIESRNLILQNLEVGFNAQAYKDLKNCIIFPLKDKFNNVVSLYGRSLSKGHYYTANRKGLFPKYPSAETRKLILTESIIDAATLLQQKEISQEYEVLALYGTNGFTQEHTEVIKGLKHLKEIVLFFDGDEAGRKATANYEKQFRTQHSTLKISLVETPKGEDINSLLDGHSSEILTELLNSRKNGSTKRQLKIEEAKPIQNDSIKTIDEQEEAKEEDQLPAVAHRLNTENPDYITYEKGDLKCVLLGGISIQQIDRLRVTLLLERVPKLSPLHSIRQSGLDLYNDSFVEKFGRTAAEKLEVGTTEIRLIIAELIEELEKYRLSQIESKREVKPEFRILNKQQKEVALKYLKAPKLLKRTNADIGKSGMIGEEVNRLLMYLVFTSRLRENPLNIICLGASGTGKTHLQEKVAELIPENDIIDATALSDNALYYFDRTALKHKLIVIEDMDGAENVLYQLRELMSKKKLSKQVVIKDSKGNMRTIQTQTEGPICVTGTTTQERIYEDNANRSLLLYLDGSKQHQEKIMDYQRSLSAGKINSMLETQTKEMFKDIQSLLKPIRIVNPYAEQLRIPQEVFKPLRSNAHYLQFIECITFYHQYQREVKINEQTGEQYIETDLEDIAAANALLKDVLLDKADELSGACRAFFEVLKHHLKKEKKQSFYAKDIRAALRISPTTLKRYLYQLQLNDYIKIVGGDKFRKGYEYEVINYEEYSELQNNIKTALDKALEKIKKQ